MSRLDLTQDLVSYLTEFKSEINQRVQEAAPPRHEPGDSHNPLLSTALRTPYPAQADVITASVKTLSEQTGLFICGEMGTGKTLIGSLIPWIAHKDHAPRTLIMCPGHLVKKWKREIELTIPDAEASIIYGLPDAISCAATPRNGKPQFWIISKETAKLSYTRTAAARTIAGKTQKENFVIQQRGSLADPDCNHPEGFGDTHQSIRYIVRNPETGRTQEQIETPVFCPHCGTRLYKKPKSKDSHAATLDMIDLEKKNRHCHACDKEYFPRNEFKPEKDGETWTYFHKNPKRTRRVYTALWTADRRKTRKVAIADYLKRRGARFDFFIADECHELKGSNTAQGNALGQFAAISEKILALTGTLIGGLASHLFYLNFRINPTAMKKAGFTYGDSTGFTKRYGVLETCYREVITKDGSTRNTSSRGSSDGTKTGESEKPGISPALFAEMLLNNALFIHLEDVAAELPPITETPIQCEMDPDLKAAYQSLERAIKDVLARQLAVGNKSLLGAYLINLLAYPDKPFDNVPIKLGKDYYHQPRELSDLETYAKERELISICTEAKNANRRVLIYMNYTGKRDMQPRISKVLSDHGIKTGILRSTIKPINREQWIQDNAAELDALIVNPECVKTGLDLIQFPVIVFFQTGYNIFTLRQAARRSWRLGQTQPVEIYYLYYKSTMQERAIQLIGRKLNYSLALEGKLTSEGLTAMMGDEDESLLLAKALIANEITDGIESTWKELNRQQAKAKPERNVDISRPEHTVSATNHTAASTPRQPDILAGIPSEHISRISTPQPEIIQPTAATVPAAIIPEQAAVTWINLNTTIDEKIKITNETESEPIISKLEPITIKSKPIITQIKPIIPAKIVTIDDLRRKKAELHALTHTKRRLPKPKKATAQADSPQIDLFAALG